MKNEMTYREILQNKYQLRTEKNKKYSLRAFAKDIGISVSLLSEIRSGKKGLSVKTAMSISKKLGLSGSEQAFFCDLVASEHARHEGARILAKDRVEDYRHFQIRNLTLESFSFIYDWYHFALLELTHVLGFQSSIEWSAKKLKIPLEMVKSSHSRLVNMGLLEIDRDGKWIDTNKDLATPDGFSFSYLRKFHRQLMEKAILALEEQSVEERDITSLMVSIDSSRLPEARKRIRDFRNEFIKEFNSEDEKKDSVYCLGIQLFNLTTKEEK